MRITLRCELSAVAHHFRENVSSPWYTKKNLCRVTYQHRLHSTAEGPTSTHTPGSSVETPPAFNACPAISSRGTCSSSHWFGRSLVIRRTATSSGRIRAAHTERVCGGNAWPPSGHGVRRLCIGSTVDIYGDTSTTGRRWIRIESFSTTITLSNTDPTASGVSSDAKRLTNRT